MPVAISTPCISVCALDAAGRTCLGCGRTVEEIGAWATLSETERRAIMARLTVRRIAGAVR
ncbi:DUF1289 domain-containing protein [Ancylobacter dichloromethanicus]|uniref:DUF1289 domain-containing protein n=1 Tax=Ancylobacter dichloromethanicus TaxID=518825 RepID=UPI001BCE6438|nr:DUF1289 domain-containing protein [Ancylobacter dichloromethanicus]MBS7552995.1 DUF1289 domain-containing protein [Ancylobacter dichloromethanicus]